MKKTRKPKADPIAAELIRNRLGAPTQELNSEPKPTPVQLDI